MAINQPFSAALLVKISMCPPVTANPNRLRCGDCYGEIGANWSSIWNRPGHEARSANMQGAMSAYGPESKPPSAAEAAVLEQGSENDVFVTVCGGHVLVNPRDSNVLFCTIAHMRSSDIYKDDRIVDISLEVIGRVAYRPIGVPHCYLMLCSKRQIQSSQSHALWRHDSQQWPRRKTPARQRQSRRARTWWHG